MRSNWPGIRERATGLMREVYAETICELSAVAMSGLPPPIDPSADGAAAASRASLAVRFGALASSASVWTVSLIVSAVASLELLLCGPDTMPCHKVREASAGELEQQVSNKTANETKRQVHREHEEND